MEYDIYVGDEQTPQAGPAPAIPTGSPDTWKDFLTRQGLNIASGLHKAGEALSAPENALFGGLGALGAKAYEGITGKKPEVVETVKDINKTFGGNPAELPEQIGALPKGYREPKSLIESGIQKFTESAPSAIAFGGAAGAIPAALGSVAGTIAKFGGKGKLGQDIAQTVVEFGSSVPAFFSGFRGKLLKQKDELYNKASTVSKDLKFKPKDVAEGVEKTIENLSMGGAITNAQEAAIKKGKEIVERINIGKGKLEKQAEQLRNKITELTNSESVPSKIVNEFGQSHYLKNTNKIAAAENNLAKIEKELLNHQIPLDEIIKSNKNLNSHIGEAIKAGDKTAADAYKQIQAPILEEIDKIRQSRNPQFDNFFKYWDPAQELHKGSMEAGAVTKWFKDNASWKGILKNPIAGSLFGHAAIQHGLKSVPKAVLAAGAGILTGKGIGNLSHAKDFANASPIAKAAYDQIINNIGTMTASNVNRLLKQINTEADKYMKNQTDFEVYI